MAFPTNPSPGDSYTDEYGTVWVYAGTVNGWYRQTVTTPNDTSYTAAISGPAGSNTQVQFNDNGELAGDSGLTYNKTTDALSGGAFIPTGSTIPSNGVYLPSANNVALSTNGTGRLFVDASGNVSVVGDISTTGGTGRLNIRGTASGVNNDLQIGNDDSFVYFRGSRSNAVSKGFIWYSDNSLSERLRITSAGLVGIGTSSPNADSQLHIVGSSYQPLYVNTTSIGGGGAAFFNSGTQALYVGTAGSSWLSGSSTADGLVRAEANLVLATNGNARAVTIDTSQRVGIGTTTPASKLHVSGDAFFTDWIYSGSSKGISSDAGIRPLLFGLGGSEKARIDSSGRLLVGTSSARSTPFLNYPDQQVESSSFASIQIVGNSIGGSGGYLNLAKSRGGAVGSNTIVQADDELGGVYFAGADGSQLLAAAVITAKVDGTPGANDMPGRLVFSTTADGASSPTERMRIRANGVISTFNSVGDSLNLYNANSAGTSNALLYGLHSATNNVSGGTICFIVYTNGNVVNTNNSYGAISDIKLKENIVDAKSQWDDIKALQVRNYNFKEGQTHTQIGLVAQEVELVSPGLVTESPDRDEEGNDLGTVTKSVNYSVLYMKAVKALQEAMERIETLEAKVAALESA